MDDRTHLHVVIATRAVAPQHGYGGLERAVAHHVRHLARLGVRLTVFTQPGYTGLPSPEDCGGRVTWREVPYRRWALPLRRNSIPDRLLHYGAFARRIGRQIADLTRRERVDVVHAHGLAGAGYATERRGTGGETGAAALPPLVLNPHGLEEFAVRSRAKRLAYAPFRWGLRATAVAADRVISTDRALDEAVSRHLRVPADRVVTIPNGVDVAALDALVESALVREARDRYGLAGAPLTIATVARLERNKGLLEALLALAGLSDRLPEGWRWLVVGAGSEERELRQTIARLGLGGNVRLLGALADRELHNLLECADLFFVPSLYEGSSLAALEGMVHRLPVVATATGGLPDKVVPGRTGYLAPPGDVAGLREALASALTERDTWAGLGARGRALVEAEFDWPRLAGRYLDLYRSLRQLGGSGGERTMLYSSIREQQG